MAIPVVLGNYWTDLHMGTAATLLIFLSIFIIPGGMALGKLQECPFRIPWPTALIRGISRGIGRAFFLAGYGVSLGAAVVAISVFPVIFAWIAIATLF
jgi:hypothetical protein